MTLKMEPGVLSIKLKLLSCKDLKSFNFFQKLSIYALVSIVSDEPNKRIENNRLEQRTPADADGDGDPEWNHEMVFDLDRDSFPDTDSLFLKFDLKHEGMLLFGDKPVGEVRVPLLDLIGQKPYGISRFVSYQVRCPEGKPNGVLNFSYQVIGNADSQPEETSPANQITGYPMLYPSLSEEEPYSPATTTVHHIQHIQHIHSSSETPSSLYPEIETDFPPGRPYYNLPPPETQFQPWSPVYPPPAGPPNMEQGEFRQQSLYSWSSHGSYHQVNAYGYSGDPNQGFVTGHQHYSNGGPSW